MSSVQDLDSAASAPESAPASPFHQGGLFPEPVRQLGRDHRSVWTSCSSLAIQEAGLGVGGMDENSDHTQALIHVTT